MNVALFDYGAGNLHSLAKALESGGGRVEITADWDRALAADALVLPGVGSFGAVVRALEGHTAEFRQALEEAADLLYHALVVLRAIDVTVEDLLDILELRGC